MARVPMCPTCGEPGVAFPFEGGVTHSYHCTAEIVVPVSGKAVTIKACPDLGRVARQGVLGSRSDGS